MDYRDYYFNNKDFNSVFLPLINETGEICHWFDLILLNNDDINRKILNILRNRKAFNLLILFYFITEIEDDVNQTLFNLSRTMHGTEMVVNTKGKEPDSKLNALQEAISTISNREKIEPLKKNTTKNEIMILLDSLAFLLDLKKSALMKKDWGKNKNLNKDIELKIYLIKHFLKEAGNETKTKGEIIKVLPIFKEIQKHIFNMNVLAYLMLKIKFSKYLKRKDFKIRPESKVRNVEKENIYIEENLNKLNLNHNNFLSKREKEDIFQHLFLEYKKEGVEIEKLSKLEQIAPFLIEKEL